MPTYIYRREDGTTFETEQRITEDPLETCPTTGQAVTRVITGGTGLSFKGSGFYLTDYARDNGSTTQKSTAKSNDSTEKSTSTSEKSTTSSEKSDTDSAKTPAAKSNG